MLTNAIFVSLLKTLSLDGLKGVGIVKGCLVACKTVGQFEALAQHQLSCAKANYKTVPVHII